MSEQLPPNLPTPQELLEQIAADVEANLPPARVAAPQPESYTLDVMSPPSFLNAGRHRRITADPEMPPLPPESNPTSLNLAAPALGRHRRPSEGLNVNNWLAENVDELNKRLPEHAQVSMDEIHAAMSGRRYRRPTTAVKPESVAERPAPTPTPAASESTPDPAPTPAPIPVPKPAQAMPSANTAPMAPPVTPPSPAAPNRLLTPPTVPNQAPASPNVAPAPAAPAAPNQNATPAPDTNAQPAPVTTPAQTPNVAPDPNAIPDDPDNVTDLTAAAAQAAANFRAANGGRHRRPSRIKRTLTATGNIVTGRKLLANRQARATNATPATAQPTSANVAATTLTMPAASPNTLNDQESRRHKIVAGIIGGMAVGAVTLWGMRTGFHFGLDGWGHHLKDARDMTGSIAKDAGSNSKDWVQEHLPNSFPGADHGHEAAKDAAKGAKDALGNAKDHVTGNKPPKIPEAVLHHGHTIWGDTAKFAADHGVKLTEDQHKHLVNEILHANHQSWESAHNLPDNYHYQIPQSIIEELAKERAKNAS